MERGLQLIDGGSQELPTTTRPSTRAVPLPAMAVRVLREHQERQPEERADAGRLRWQDTDSVFTSTVGTPLEPRDVSRDLRAPCDSDGFRRVRLGEPVAVNARCHDQQNSPPTRVDGPFSRGGAEGTRTPDPHTASVMRYQLRHSPNAGERYTAAR